MKVLITKHQKKVIVVMIALLSIMFGVETTKFEPLYSFLYETQPGYYRVISVNDGDTITIDMAGSEETIRFIGVNTPETHHPSKPVQCFGQEASNFTSNLLRNHDVRLEADQLNDNRDRYGRLLRYVYLEDGTFVNLELVKRGYGFAYTSFPMINPEQFIEAQAEARINNQGLWAGCTIDESNANLETAPV